jgi:hypothetical protein
VVCGEVVVQVVIKNGCFRCKEIDNVHSLCETKS